MIKDNINLPDLFRIMITVHKESKFTSWGRQESCVGAQIAPYPNRSHRSDLGILTQIALLERFGYVTYPNHSHGAIWVGTLSYPNSSNVIETICYLIYSTFIRILKRSYDRLLGKISVSEKGDINLRNSSVREDDRSIVP